MPSSALKLVGVVRPYGKPGLTPKGLSQVYFLVKVSDNIHTDSPHFKINVGYFTTQCLHMFNNYFILISCNFVNNFVPFCQLYLYTWLHCVTCPTRSWSALFPVWPEADMHCYQPDPKLICAVSCLTRSWSALLPVWPEAYLRRSISHVGSGQPVWHARARLPHQRQVVKLGRILNKIFLPADTLTAGGRRGGQNSSGQNTPK